jgi:hypothetical protein
MTVAVEVAVMVGVGVLSRRIGGLAIGAQALAEKNNKRQTSPAKVARNE